MRKLLQPVVAALMTAAVAAAPAQAVVGGHDASPGEYPSVAKVSFGVFGCTGTLVAREWVLSAGHCSSVGTVNVGSINDWPAAAIRVEIGGTNLNRSTGTTDGEVVPVADVLTNPSYIGLDYKHDVALLRLARPSTKAPTQVAGASERGIWTPGTLATIAGWGVTREGGSTPTRLQEARVPITADEDAERAYPAWLGPLSRSAFDRRTMVAAGFPGGGVDTCQGDSGGPLFAPVGGTLRVVGATSYGEGCARPGKPGVYARVADEPLRGWIASVAGGAVAGAATAKSTETDRERSAR